MTDIPPFDSYWEELRAFLVQTYDAEERLVVPAPLDRLFSHACVPQDVAEGDSDIAAVVIHKGDYLGFDPDFLYHALMRGRPVFANPVFVVVAHGEAGDDRLVDDVHIGALADICDWARRHAADATVAAYPDQYVEYAPTDALARMARLIVRDLVKPITGTSHTTVVETAKPFGGTRWFWGDDAAKVAELFCLPEIHVLAPQLVDQLIDVILALSPSSIIRRRIGPVSLEIEQDAPDDFRILSPFTITFGNLSRGEVRQAIRFNDGRTRPLVCHAPGKLGFIWRDEHHEIELADAICASRIEPHGDSVTLRYVASIRRPDDAGRELASVDCVWALHPGRNALSFNMTLRPAPFVTLRDVTLASGMRELGELGAFDRITTATGGIGRPYGPAEWPEPEIGGTIASLACPDASYIGIWEGHSMPGHAVGLHIVPQTEPIMQLRLERTDAERLAVADMVYRVAKVSARRPYSIRETRLLTAGGYYDEIAEYAALTEEGVASCWCQDPSMTYDTGVELNAVATHLFFALQDSALTDRQTKLKSWYDRHLALYLDHVRPGEPHQHERIFVRGLAFVILSLDVMERCFPQGDYRKTVDLLTGLLRDTEVPVEGAGHAGLFSNGPPSDPARPELDSQGAALLALARRAWANKPEAWLSAAIERGVMAMRVDTPSVATYGNEPLDHETLVIGKDALDPELIDTGFWTYKLGLALRAFAVIEAGCAAERLTLSDAARNHVRMLAEVCRNAVMRSAVCRGDSIEILTSHNAGETNSETQPWVALGLVPLIDEKLLGFPVVRQDTLRFSAVS